MSGKVLSESDIACYRDGIDILGVQQICESHEQLRELVKAQRLALYSVIADNDERFEELGEKLRKMSNARIDAERGRERAEEALRNIMKHLEITAGDMAKMGGTYNIARAYFAEGTCRGQHAWHCAQESDGSAGPCDCGRRTGGET